jgi:hypothetical protein
MRGFLTGQRPTAATLDFLADEFLPAVVATLNEPGTRRRMALYGGDRIPENESNLTDVRTRMSLLIEYKLAWIGNDILEEHGITDLFWTNVVANRFPDLEVRDDQGCRGVRVEVKCLQAIAEEKSANFDTLKKDLNPNTDYIVVFIWEWFRDQAAIVWDRAPRIMRAFVFHASSLAELRDYNWLENPPNNLGDGYQGFDLRHAVNCRNGQYNEEEGNYGKLLRIWSGDVVYRPGLSDILTRTIETYRAFEDFAVWSGFEVLAPYLLSQAGAADSEAIMASGHVVGYRARNLAIVFKRRVPTTGAQREVAQHLNLERLIVMTDKYQWVEARPNAERLQRYAHGRKPKHLALHLSGSSAPSGTE